MWRIFPVVVFAGVMLFLPKRIKAQNIPGSIDLLKKWLFKKHPPVVYLYGPAGVGKTGLLNSFIKLLPGAGFKERQVRYFELAGRSLEDVVTLFMRLIRDFHEELRLLILDGIDECAGLSAKLRNNLLPLLNLKTKIILAGRKPPGLEWATDPAWRELTLPVPLKDLDRPEAEAFLQNLGINRKKDRDRIFLAACGRPLVLKMLAEHFCNKTVPEKISEIIKPAARETIARFTREGAEEKLYPYLEAAALTWQFNRELLEEMSLSPAGYYQLIGHSFVHDIGEGFTLDPVLRRAIQAGTSETQIKKIRAKIIRISREDALANSTALLNTLCAALNDEGRERLFTEGPLNTTLAKGKGFPAFDFTGWDQEIAGPPGSPAKVLELATDCDKEVLTVISAGRPAGFAVFISPAGKQKIRRELKKLADFIRPFSIPEISGILQGEGKTFPVTVVCALGLDPDAADWARAALLRHLLCQTAGKGAIVFPHPAPGLSFILRQLGFAEISSGETGVHGKTSIFWLNTAGENLALWLDNLPANEIARNAGQIRQNELIDAVRQVLRFWRSDEKLAASPLLELTGKFAPGENKKPAVKFLRRCLTAAVEHLKQKDALLARLVEEAYFKEQVNYKRLAAKLRLSERTFYRRLREGCLEIGKNILAQFQVQGGVLNAPDWSEACQNKGEKCPWAGS